MLNKENQKRSEAVLVRSLFNRNSVFFRILVVLIAFILIIILTLAYFTYSLMIRNQQNEFDSTNFNLLSQSEKIISIKFDSIIKTAETFLKDPQFMRYIINPYSDDTVNEYEIIAILEGYKNSESLLKNVYFISSFSNTILSAAGEKADVNEYADNAFILDHVSRMGNDPQSLIKDYSSDLFYYGNRLFIACDSMFSSHYGGIISEIDISMLYDLIASDSGMYIFDQKNKLIQNGTVSGAGFINIADNGTNQKTVENGYIYYSYYSPETGLKLINMVDEKSVSWSVGDAVLVFFVGLISIILLSVGAVWLISSYIYKPVGKLTKTILQGMSVDLSEKAYFNGSELDYLQQVWTQTISEKRHLQDNISKLSLDVLERTVHKLFMGREISREELMELLDNLSRPFDIDDRFIVLLCRNSGARGSDPTGLITNLLFMTIKQILVSNIDLQVKPLCILCDRETVGVLLCFGKDSSAYAIKNEAGRLADIILKETADTSFPVIISKGRAVSQLTDVGSSFKVALDALNYLIYINNDESKKKSETPRMFGNELAGRNSIESISSIFDYLMLGESQKASSSLSMLLQAAEGSSESMDEFRGRCEFIVDAFIEKLLSVSVEMDAEEKDALTFDTTGLDSIELIKANTTEFCGMVMEKIEYYYKKGKFRYIQAAKLYIEENYSNCQLSAVEVSEHIGISTAYFSELFNEITHESFNVYLNSVRVNRAKDMLSMTRIQISEIGFKCGFSAAQSFNRVFKKYTNLTPSQYRENCIKYGRKT